MAPQDVIITPKEVLSPQETGLPPKFTEWRGNQEQAISAMLNSPKRIIAISAPTGFGKSPAYIAFALLSGQPTCIVTNSKGLQDQLMKDYASIGLVDIRGRNNYACAMRDDYTCQDGHSSQCPFKGTVGCPSSQAEMRAATSSLVVTNYDKWIASKRYGQGLQHLTQVVFDEGHDAPDALSRAMQTNISFDDIEKLLKLDYPMDTQVFGCWKAWAAHARMEAEALTELQLQKINDAGTPKVSWIREYHHLKDLTRRLAIISMAKVDEWVVDEVEHGFQFDPVWPGRYAESTLLLRMPRIIVVSATLRPKTLAMLGVAKDKYDFHEFSSDFDPTRCPIYWVPTMRVDARAHDLSLLWLKLDQLAARRQDRKGIVHTISYSRQRDVLSQSRFSRQMMINQRGTPINDTVDRFKRSNPGTLLVSPSVSTGFDFPGAECEWQFVCKIPFPDGRTKILKARNKQDPEYGAYMAMQALVQTFGRGMRSKSDRCENFIVDDHMEWFLPRYRHLAPKSFSQFFRREPILPQPPARLGDE